MTLKELIKNIKTLAVTGSTDKEITGVDIDSRQVSDGHLFVAMRGTQVDGHRFIGKAEEQGYLHKGGIYAGCSWACCNNVLWQSVGQTETDRRNRY